MIFDNRFITSNTHCVKSIRLRSYSGPEFPAFEMNNSEYG